MNSAYLPFIKHDFCVASVAHVCNKARGLQTYAHLQYGPNIATSCGKRATVVYVSKTCLLHKYYYNLWCGSFEILMDLA